MIVSPLYARLVLIGAVKLWSYRKEGGLGAGLREAITLPILLFHFVWIAGITYVMLGTKGILLFLSTIVLGSGFTASIYRRLQVLTGDCYGAIVEWCEVTSLFFLLLRYGGCFHEKSYLRDTEKLMKNAARCYLGHFDACLNETGRQQIHRLAEHVRQVYGKEITRIYCSDLSRTRESAEIIGSYLQLQPVSIHALRELHFGDWECETYDSIRERDLLQEWIQNPFQIAPPHGETLQQLGNRVDTWLSHILLHEKEDETILVMSHGGPIRWVLAKWIFGRSAGVFGMQKASNMAVVL
ncbi:hypothetical protein GCM10020331_062150 [Ectobacillus funiculus]